MKKINLIILSLVSLLTFGCKDPYLAETGLPSYVGKDAVLTFSGEGSIIVDKLGGEYSATFTSNLPWMAASSDPWMTITSADRGIGGPDTQTVTFSVSKNASVNPRTGRIRIWIDSEHEAYIDIKQGEMTLEELANKYYVKVGGTGDGSSWAKASGDLSRILENASNGDKVYVAAGTYTPSTMFPGASGTNGQCFYVSGNIGLYGGFPADAEDGDTADPKANETILDGTLSSGNSYHVVIVAATPDPLFHLEVNGFKITNGVADANGSSVALNYGRLYGYHGAGLCIVNSVALIKNCNISNNASPKGTAGVYVGDGAAATFEDCVIADNNGSGNGPGFVNSASKLTLDRCIIERSKSESGGVGGGLYLYDMSGAKRLTETYVFNCVIRDNDNKSSASSRVGAGLYAREGSKTWIVNSTINGNLGGGGAVACYGTAADKSEMTIISSTITGNVSAFVGGGLQAMQYSAIKVFNSIISGNTAAGNAVDILSAANATAPIALSGSVVTDKVYSKDGNAVSGLLFDPAAMLSLSGNHFALTGTDNPAITSGMTSDELRAIPEAEKINSEILLKDAAGNSRTTSAMGAYIGR